MFTNPTSTGNERDSTSPVDCSSVSYGSLNDKATLLPPLPPASTNAAKQVPPPSDENDVDVQRLVEQLLKIQMAERQSSFVANCAEQWPGLAPDPVQPALVQRQLSRSRFKNFFQEQTPMRQNSQVSLKYLIKTG